MRDTGFDITIGRLAALRNDGRGPSVLALHGWLDNAASFLPMAPFLRDFDLVALDLPGHGRSACLPPGAEYAFGVNIAAVLDVADALGWDRFHLLGHSMGAGIASLIAAACPDRIERLVAIEMLGALAEPPTRAAARLREAVAAQRTLADKRLRVFPDIDTAVRARLHAGRVPGSGLDAELLRLLVTRGVRAVPGGFTWSSDPRLMLPSLMRHTREQVDDLLAAITCPTLAVFAEPAQPYLPDDERRRRIRLLPQGRLLTLPGGHHLHMQQPAPVAAAVTEFLTGH